MIQILSRISAYSVICIAAILICAGIFWLAIYRKELVVLGLIIFYIKLVRWLAK